MLVFVLKIKLGKDLKETIKGNYLQHLEVMIKVRSVLQHMLVVCLLSGYIYIHIYIYIYLILIN